MKRIEKLQKHFHDWGIDILIIDNPVDLYYLTGQELSTGRLFIQEKEAELYVDGRYFEACKKEAPLPVKLYEKETAYPTFGGKKIGFDSQYTTFEAYEKLSVLKGKRIPLSNPTKRLRQIKESEEIALLRKAADLGSRGFDFILSLLQEGITEEDLSVELELFWRKSGGEKVAFNPLIAFGKNSAYPHYHSRKNPLKRGDIVLIDIGVVVDHYHSDMTRVISFGEPDKTLAEIYQIVRESQLAALELCKPGTPIEEIDKAARNYIEEKGYGPYFLHSLGHGVGLEIHEAPWIRKSGEGILEEGMVITIEPGIYLAGTGGVRLEDTIAITREGYENLTQRPVLPSLPIH